MTLKERLAKDLKQAMRDKDERRKVAIRMVSTAVRNAEVEKLGELSDEEVLAVIAKQAKQRRESIAEFRKAGRQDLVDQEEAELEILTAYLPEQMTRREIEDLARQVIEEVGGTDPRQMGPVMRQMMAKVAGRADGRLVNQIVKELLAGDG